MTFFICYCTIYHLLHLPWVIELSLQIVHALHEDETIYPRKINRFSDNDDLEIKLIDSKVKLYRYFRCQLLLLCWQNVTSKLFLVQDLSSENFPVSFSGSDDFEIKLIDVKVR